MPGEEFGHDRQADTRAFHVRPNPIQRLCDVWEFGLRDAWTGIRNAALDPGWCRDKMDGYAASRATIDNCVVKQIQKYLFKSIGVRRDEGQPLLSMERQRDLMLLGFRKHLRDGTLGHQHDVGRP